MYMHAQIFWIGSLQKLGAEPESCPPLLLARQGCVARLPFAPRPREARGLLYCRNLFRKPKTTHLSKSLKNSSEPKPERLSCSRSTAPQIFETLRVEAKDFFSPQLALWNAGNMARCSASVSRSYACWFLKIDAAEKGVNVGPFMQGYKWNSFTAA